MNFDYTYIAFGNFLIFEPLIIVSNAIFFSICLWYFSKLRKFSHLYGRRMAGFVLWMGISSIFGALSHSVHYQLGSTFFGICFYLMNALSLGAIYCCFRASYAYSHSGSAGSRLLVYIVKSWVFILLILAAVLNDFLLIKIHAGVVMLYAITVHFLMQQQNRWNANKLVIGGIAISFISILVHSSRFSLHEWFNYKDIAHVFMIFGLLVMARGLVGVSERLESVNKS